MNNNQQFALLGVAGFIAPRHLKAIAETKSDLIAAFDPHDSVGIVDSWFPNAAFFTEFERLDRHVEKLRREERGIDYVSICTPNYLHDAHVRFALRSGATAICEKPLVLNPWNVDALAEVEAESEGRIQTILQLRLHPAIVALHDRHACMAEVDAATSPPSGGRGSNEPSDEIVDIDVTYITSRGGWYHHSWKGDEEKSGGVATNIGIHFFDMLAWIFGQQVRSIVHIRRPDCMAGVLELERARVRWFLSVNGNHLPEAQQAAGQRTYRSITIGGEEIEFSGGFTDLHTDSYRRILGGEGFGIEDARGSIELAHDIRHAPITALREDYHPLCQMIEL